MKRDPFIEEMTPFEFRQNVLSARRITLRIGHTEIGRQLCEALQNPEYVYADSVGEPEFFHYRKLPPCLQQLWIALNSGKIDDAYPKVNWTEALRRGDVIVDPAPGRLDELRKKYAF